MGQKFGRAEAVHEILVDVEFQVGDAVPDAVHFFKTIAEVSARVAPPRELLPSGL